MVALAFFAVIGAFVGLLAIGAWQFAVGWAIFVAGLCLIGAVKKKVLT